MDHQSLETQFRNKIPYERGTEEYKAYEALIPFLGNPQPLLVITDIEQDLDDLLAVLILSHMHYLGIVNLVGLVANHKPSLKRAKFLRTVLHLQDIPEVPVAVGTDGTGGKENRERFWHELRNQTFELQPWNHVGFLDGYELIDRLAQQADENKVKLTVLCISSLQDISEFFDKQDGAALQKRFATFVSQGGYEIRGKSLLPDMKAMNNIFHQDAAKNYTDCLTSLGLRSDAWTKEVAIAAALDRSVLDKLPGPLGHHIRWVSKRQEFKYGWDAIHKPFLPHLNKEWFFSTRKAGTFPAYDACAAMGALGDGVLRSLGILNGLPSTNTYSHRHRVFGASRDDLGGIDAAKLKFSIQVFLEGSLRVTSNHAEALIPTETLSYPAPKNNITWETFLMQMPHLEKMEAFRRAAGRPTEEAIEKFKRGAFGENKLQDEYGNTVKDLEGRDCPMIPETIPYEMLYQFDSNIQHWADGWRKLCRSN